MKKMLKKILPIILYNLLKKAYSLIIPTQQPQGINPESLRKNSDIFVTLNFDENAIRAKLKRYGYNYEDKNLSWHYHIFTGWYEYCYSNNKEINNILEIGTHDGRFTNFLSKIYDSSKIFTIDLPQNDEFFINSYGREKLDERNKFIETRSKNLDRSNIKFSELNSINIANFFNDMKFDAIWVDGDHHNPQVTLDILNCLNLLNKGGLMCVDDVIKDGAHVKDDYISNESYKTLEHLEKNNLIQNYFIIKRTRNSVSNTQKYVSVSTLL